MPDGDEIDDSAVRNAIELFLAYLEFLVLALLSQHSRKTLAEFDSARAT